MCDRIDNEDTASYVLEEKFRVYIGCSLTSDDCTGLRDSLLEQVEAAFRDSGFLVHNPSSHTKPGSPHLAREVTAFDHLQVMRCDLIFFIRVQPSLGMGIEAHIAADTLIPWADAKVSKDFHKLAPLLAGLPNPLAGIRLYFEDKNVEDLVRKLREFLKGSAFRKRLQDVQYARGVASALIGRIGIGRAIRRQRLLLNMSLGELAELVDLEPWWIGSIESAPTLANCLTFLQLMRLVDATRLRWVPAPLPSEQFAFPGLAPVDSFSYDILQAAEEFTDYSLRPRLLGEPPPDNDEQMLAHWREWLSKSKGIELPPRPKVSAAPVGGLTAFLAMPLSNVEVDKEIRLKAVIAAIRSAFKQIGNVSLYIEEPEYVASARADHGPEIYLATIRRLSRCDFAIVLAQPPATGVGIVTRLFANATLQCLAIAEKGNPVSRMFEGMYCRWIDEIIDYVSTEEVSTQVKEVLGKHMTSLCKAAARRRVVRDRIIGASVTVAVDRFRIPRRLGFEEAIRQLKAVPFIRCEWLDALARDPAILQTATLLQFVHIARELEWGIGLSSSGVPCLLPPHYVQDGEKEGLLGDRYAEVLEESLGNLIDARDTANQRLSAPVDDQVLFDEWEEYRDEISSRDAGDLEHDQPVLTAKEWLEVLLRSQPSGPVSCAAPTSQMLLPGMEDNIADAALFLMGIAKHGLPTCVITEAVDQPLENVERALATELEAAVVRSDDGIWTMAKECDDPPPTNATHLLHRAVGSLLTSLEYDKDAAFGHRLLRSAFLLGSAGKPLPPTLTARLYILQKKRSEAYNVVHEQIKGVNNQESNEYVELLIVLGRAASTFDEAAGCLDEAIKICERNSARGDGHDSDWTELAARAKHARGLASMEFLQGNPGPHLSTAAELWQVVGNELGRSVAEWHLLLSEDKKRVLEKQKTRLEQESPLIRVEAVCLYKARAASSSQPVLSQRKELPALQCEEFIRNARFKLFGRPTGE